MCECHCCDRCKCMFSSHVFSVTSYILVLEALILELEKAFLVQNPWYLEFRFGVFLE